MMGTRVSPRDRPAENSGSTSKGGMVPNSSQNSTARSGSRPPLSSAILNSSRLRFWIMRLAIKFLVVSSSGRIGRGLPDKGLRVQRAVKAEDLLHLRVQEHVQPGHGGGEHRGHGLIRRVEGGARHPPGLVVRRQTAHEQLEAEK